LSYIVFACSACAGGGQRTHPIRVCSCPPSTKFCVYISTYVVSKYNREKTYQWGLGMMAHSHSPHIPALTSDLCSHVQCGAVVVAMRCSDAMAVRGGDVVDDVGNFGT
jgi:hypothetical protein